MRNLTLGDLQLALGDLLGDRLPLLERSAAGRLYEPVLRSRKEAIDALPEALVQKTPLAGELAETDIRHDGLGAAVFYLAEAIAAHPFLPAELKATARRAQQSFVPELRVLRATYDEEAAAAREHRPLLDEQATALRQIATPGGGTLLEWVRGFLDAGHDLAELLRDRAELVTHGQGVTQSAPLRSVTVGILGRFREALRDEVEARPGALPPDYERHLFAYVDQLVAEREAVDRLRRRGADVTP